MPNEDTSATSEDRRQDAATHGPSADSPRDDGSSLTATEPSGTASVEAEAPSINSSAPQGSQNAETRESRPPLPPRPTNLSLLQENNVSPENLSQRPGTSSRPGLQSIATTALSRTDIHTQSHQDGSRETFAASTETTPSTKYARGYGSIRKFRGLSSSEGADSASIRSYAPTFEAGGDAESLLGDVLGASHDNPAWNLFRDHGDAPDVSITSVEDEDEVTADFYQEFDELRVTDQGGNDEEQLLKQWKSKQKHFLILSSAGKPIYSRHGNDNVVSSFIGIIQTIISFYEGAKDQLKGFTAASTRFVIMSQGPLYLVAISKLGESDTQLRVQLEALYMQILSTLTLPTLNHLFSNRPSTDLRRPLKGTEVLLSALADTFTRGSPPTLLSALECLKLRKSHRQIINDTLLSNRCDDLLYGLIIAGGRLVSVVRPRRHSLHPSDLQLIFNMLFEADGIKAGGGENWIPLCLPGFNKNGYLYMYVSFVVPAPPDSPTATTTPPTKENPSTTPSSSFQPPSQDSIAILLISPNKESFYDLRKMRDAVISDLEKNNSMTLILTAIHQGRPAPTDILPGTVLRHFLYKSRANVQFTMPSYDPHFSTLLARRQLLTHYHHLHAATHVKPTHPKVQHSISRSLVSLAWTTPLFELYCVAGPNCGRTALAQGAGKVVQWVKREEERVFIIGGAVF